MARPRRAITTTGLARLALATVFLAGCDATGSAVMDGPGVQFSKAGSCPGGPSCKTGGGNGSTPSGTIDMTVDGTLVAADQAVDISKDSQSELTLQGGSAFASVLSYFTAAGSPSLSNLAALGCVKDPSDLPDATAQRLIDRLTDATQPRTIAVDIKRKVKGDPNVMNGSINQAWTDDADGTPYRTWLFNSFLLGAGPPTVVEGPPDTFTFTGGAITSWDQNTGEQVVCPNVGTIVVTLTR